VINIFLIIQVKIIGLKFDICVFLFLCFFNLELLFLYWNSLLRFFSFLWLLFFLLLFLLLFYLFLFCNFSLFDPLLNQIALLKCYQSVLSVFNFEADSKSLMLGILSRRFKISNMFIKSIYAWLIFD